MGVWVCVSVCVCVCACVGGCACDVQSNDENETMHHLGIPGSRYFLFLEQSAAAGVLNGGEIKKWLEPRQHQITLGHILQLKSSD